MADLPAAPRLAKLFSLSLDMLGVADFRGYFLELSPSWERVLGHSTAELCAVPYIEFVHPDDRPTTLAKAALHPEGGSVISFENRYRCKDGSYRWLEWNCTPSVEEELVYFVARDVTEQRSLSARQRDAEERLGALLAHLPIALWEIDTQGIILHAAGRGVGSTGSTPADFIGKNVFELYPSASAGAARRALGGEVVHGATSNAHNVHWSSWFVPLRDGAGQVSRVLGVSLDVSDARTAEHELREKLALIERQQRVISSLSTPIVEVWEKVVALPMLGVVDSTRGAEVMESLLHEVSVRRAQFAILDLTGVDAVDTATAGHLIKLIRALRLLGAEGIITGIRPTVAQTMVSLGIDLAKVITLATLRDGIQHSMNRLAKPAT